MRLLIWLLIGYAVYLMFRKSKAHVSDTKADTAEDAFLDPVCGIYVGEAEAVIGRHEGKKIHFCSRECLEKYREMIESGKP